MPNKDVHFVGGALAGLGVGLATAQLVAEKDRFTHVLACVVSAAGAALLPDMLEPATSPNHRGAAHSLATATAIGVVAQARHHARCLALANECEVRATALATGSAPWQDEMRSAQLWRLAAAVVLGSIAGYGSHLVLDGATPKSLPVFISGA